MHTRIDPYAVEADAMEELISFQDFLHLSELDRPLIEMVRARVSQVNGCVQGFARHSRNASALGESLERLSALETWTARRCFSPREQAAFRWAEAVTSLADSETGDQVFEVLRHWFTEAEIVKLTVIVAAINAWNRVELSFSAQSLQPDSGHR